MFTLYLIKYELNDGKKKVFIIHNVVITREMFDQNIFLPYIFQLLRKKDEKNKPS